MDTQQQRLRSEQLGYDPAGMITNVTRETGARSVYAYDPIGISGGLNQYAFCANNPVMFVDPEGLKEL